MTASNGSTGAAVGLSAEEKRALLRGLLKDASSTGASAGVWRLSSAQRRLWELETGSGAHGVHNFSLAYEIHGPLDANVLEQALRVCANIHPALRARIVAHEDGPILEPAPIQEPILERRSWPAGDPEEAFREEASHSLDPSAGPAWHCVLFQRSQTDHVLVLHFHHVISDRWSVAVFVTDLHDAYSAIARGEQPNAGERKVPPPPVEDPRQLEFWKAEFAAPAPALALPAAAVEVTGGYEGRRTLMKIDPDVVDGLKKLAVAQSTTLFPVVLSVFGAMLNRHTTQTDLVICTAVTGRHRPETRGAIGYFNNILPLRLRLEGDPEMAEQVRNVTAMTRRAFANQDIPFHSIASLPELSGFGITRCLFAVQNIPGLDLDLPECEVHHHDIGNGTSNFDLSVFLEEQRGEVALLVDYKTSVYDQARIEQLMNRFHELLRIAGAAPETRLSQLPQYSVAPSLETQPAVPKKVSIEDETIIREEPRLQERMLELWQEMFRRAGADAISLDSNFFHVGGDSMKAARLFARIDEVFGVELPLSTLFEAPTPRLLVKKVGASDQAAAWLCLVPVQPKGSRPPLFFVHGGGGNVISFKHLADVLGPDQPVYFVQAKGLKRGDLSFSCIEDMAEHYLKAIRRVRPHGPYYLAGHSLGAIVSYEMAQRLKRDGEEVPFLGMLDQPGPDVKITTFDWLRYHWINLSMLTPEERTQYFMRSLLWRARLAKAKLGMRGDAKTKVRAEAPPTRWSHVEVMKNSLRALRDYKITPYPGRVILFRAAQGSPRILADAFGGWRQAAQGGVDVHDVPGTHMSILVQPHAGMLAKAIAGVLEKISA